MAKLKAHSSVQSVRWKTLLAKDSVFFRKVLQGVLDSLELPAENFSVSLVFSNDAFIHELNRDYRAKDKPTNVLSFPLITDFANLHSDRGAIELGDVILAFETCAREAKEQKKTLRDHTAHLLVHGLLHLFGYDHMTKKDAAEMEALEMGILERFGIEDPYL